jgi:carbon monoxide dehydrogenase subunit G
MEFVGDYRFKASAAEVWQALNDPAVLKATIPGCETMTRVTPTDFAGHVAYKVSVITLAFDGKITLSELDPPTSYRISVEAHGKFAGSAAGTAKVRLVDLPNGSHIHYEASTEIGGRLATLGAKLMQGTATRYADKFFVRFAEAMAQRTKEVDSPPPA